MHYSKYNKILSEHSWFTDTWEYFIWHWVFKTLTGNSICRFVEYVNGIYKTITLSTFSSSFVNTEKEILIYYRQCICLRPNDATKYSHLYQFLCFDEVWNFLYVKFLQNHDDSIDLNSILNSIVLSNFMSIDNSLKNFQLQIPLYFTTNYT